MGANNVGLTANNAAFVIASKAVSNMSFFLVIKIVNDRISTYHFSCVSNQSTRVISSVSIPDLNQPITTPTDYLLVVKVATENGCQ